jgi:Methyltransferase domain
MIKQILKSLLKPVQRGIRLLLDDVIEEFRPPPVGFVRAYIESGVADCIDYAKNNFKECLIFRTREELWDYGMRLLGEEKSPDDSLHLEFGTWEGYSINHFSRRLPGVHFYGFDSFEGLKEDWKGWTFQKGFFDLKGRLPKVNSNVTLIKGCFDVTTPGFLQKFTGKIKFLHIDCDTYESSKVVLELVKDRIIPGTYILFDEYIGFSGWRIGEYKSFQEFVAEHKIRYEYLGFSDNQVLVKIL